MRIRRFRMLGAVLTAGVALTLAFGSFGVGTASTALGAATTVTILSGEVTVKHADGGVFVAVIDGDIVRPGDMVRTATDARAVITYFEGSSVIIEPATLLIVDEAAPIGGGTVVTMTQLAGRTWHVVTKLVNSFSRYEVRTPASTASVRGTRFLVEAETDRTAITTAEGRVVAAVPEPRTGSIVEVPVAAGMTQIQERSAPPAPAHPAEPAADRSAPGSAAPAAILAARTAAATGAPDQRSREDAGSSDEKGLQWRDEQHKEMRLVQRRDKKGGQATSPASDPRTERRTGERVAEQRDVKNARDAKDTRHEKTSSAKGDGRDGRDRDGRKKDD